MGRRRSTWSEVQQELLWVVLRLLLVDWFEAQILPEIKTLPGKKILIGGNLSSHFNSRVLKLAQEHQIEFVCLPPNSTHFLQPLDVAFFGPLKQSWRKILNEWKLSRGKRAATLTKDAFPRLLKKLQSALFGDGENHSENLASGFRKCGIAPFSPKAALERLPDCDLQCLNESTSSTEDISVRVSNAVIDILKELRGMNEEPTKKRKKMNVLPGKSIKITDLEDSCANGCKNFLSAYYLPRIRFLCVSHHGQTWQFLKRLLRHLNVRLRV